MLVLGIDAGGSTTRAFVYDQSEAVVFHGQSGAANWASTPASRLRQHLQRALIDLPKVDAVCGCFAGLLTSEDQQNAKELLQALTNCSKVDARPDFHATWASAPEPTTAIVISGTGSVVCSEPERNKIIRTGGGGPLFGDLGSSFGIARRAITNHLYQNQVLPREFFDAATLLLGVSDMDSIIAKIYHSGAQSAAVAKLAPAIIDAARAGHGPSKAAILEELRGLAGLLIGHLKKYHDGEDSWHVTLAGGLWKNGRWLRQAFEEAAQDDRTIVWQRLVHPPVWGAARLARRILE